MIIKLIDSKKDCERFAVGCNRAFLQRSSSRIPFRELTPVDLADCDLYSYSNEKGEMIGGVGVKRKENNCAILKHIWIDPDMQGNGYGKVMLEEVEKAIICAGGGILSQVKCGKLLYACCETVSFPWI